jgi:hypothetical protein
MEEKGIKVFGVLKKDKFLEAVTVRKTYGSYNGGLVCCEDKLE